MTMIWRTLLPGTLLCLLSTIAMAEDVASLQLFSNDSSSCTFEQPEIALVKHHKMLRGTATIHCETTGPAWLFTTLPPSSFQNENITLYLADAACQGESFDSHHPARFAPRAGKQQLTFCVDSAHDLYGVIPVSVAGEEQHHGLPTQSITHTVYFDHDSDALDSSSTEALRHVLSQFGPHRDYQFDLYAHTSVVGDASYNLDLSRMRLAAVRQWLIDEGGIRQQNTWGQAYGNQRPSNVRGEALPDMEADNRRVDIVIYPHQDGELIETYQAPRINVTAF